MVLVLLHWIVLWISLPLVGYLLFTIVYKNNTSRSYFEYLWIGYAGLTGYLQLISLFLPMKSKFVLMGFILICFLGIFSIIEKYRKFSIKNLYLQCKKRWRYILIILTFIFLGLYSSTKNVTLVDTYLYHFNMVAWNRNYPVVPGLANLHDRLGFNSSFLLVAGFVERFLKQGYSTFILNGYLTISLLIYYFFIAIKKTEGRFVRSFATLMLPFIISMLFYNETSSLSTDLPVGIFSLIFTMSLIQKRQSYLYMITLALLLPTLKLSGIIAPLFIFTLLFIKRIKVKTIISKSIVGLIIFLGFIGRNIILSGYPLYPLVIFGLNIKWKVPMDRVNALISVINAYPKMSNLEYLNSPNKGTLIWLGDWWLKVKNKIEIKMFIFGLLSFITLRKQLFQKDKYKYLLIFAYSFTSILLLLTMSPDIRFGTAYFWIFGIGTITTFITNNIKRKDVQLLVCSLATITLISFYILPNFKFNESPVYLFDLSNHIGIKQLTKESLIDGTTLWRPKGSDLCGNERLVCTPNATTGVVLINVNDISKGFYLKQ